MAALTRNKKKGAKSLATPPLKKVAKSQKPPLKKQRKGISEEKPEVPTEDEEENEHPDEVDDDDTVPLGDDFLDGSDDEEGHLGSDSDSDTDGSDLVKITQAIDEERKRQEQDAKDEFQMNIKEQPDEFQLPTQKVSFPTLDYEFVPFMALFSYGFVELFYIVQELEDEARGPPDLPSLQMRIKESEYHFQILLLFSDSWCNVIILGVIVLVLTLPSRFLVYWYYYMFQLLECCRILRI